MLEFVAIVVFVLLAWAALAATVFVIKAIVWLVLLPFRLLFAARHPALQPDQSGGAVGQFVRAS